MESILIIFLKAIAIRFIHKNKLLNHLMFHYLLLWELQNKENIQKKGFYTIRSYYMHLKLFKFNPEKILFLFQLNLLKENMPIKTLIFYHLNSNCNFLSLMK